MPPAPIRAFPRTTQLLAWLLLWPLAGCPAGDKADSKAAWETQAQVARESAASLFAEESYGKALAELEPLLAIPRPDPRDQLRAALTLLELSDGQAGSRALELLQTASRALPEDPQIQYSLGRRFYNNGDFQQALVHFRKAQQAAPQDLPTQLRISDVLSEFAQEAEEPEAGKLFSEALGLLEGLEARGLEFNGSWHLTVLYKLGTLLRNQDQADRAEAVLQRLLELEGRGIKKPTSKEMERGDLGRLDIPRPRGSLPPKLPDPSFSPAMVLATGGPVQQVANLALVERWHPLLGDDLLDKTSLPPQVDAARYVLDLPPSELDTLWSDARGLWVLSAGGQRELLIEGAIERFVGLDLGEDKGLRDTVDGRLPDGREFRRPYVNFVDTELVVVRDGRLELWERPDYWESGPYQRRAVLLEALPGATEDLIAWDYDHDGDLDLALCGAYGARFLRNDGADGSGVFSDDSASFALAPGAAPIWLLPEDFDSDQDVDLLIGGPQGALYFDSLRAGKFADVSNRLPNGQDWSRRPLAADLDSDFFTDLILPASGQLLKNGFGESFRPLAGPRAVHPGSAPALLTDFDLNGSVDLVWLAADQVLTAWLDLGLPSERPSVGPLDAWPAEVGAPGCLALGPGNSLLVGASSGLARLGYTPAAPGFTLALKGLKDTSHGLGATVELRAGPIYRRIYWRDESLTLGLGGLPQIDVLRVTWPNGVIQSQLDLPAGSGRVFEQIEGLVGSCPFLYAWNGKRFEFITDCIGITPLGLPIAPGVLVPPDHDEFVLIRGQQLAARDGLLSVQVTEELREITYLDQARLIVVDHPAGSSVYPNERFTFPPFPVEHIFTISESVLPSQALDDQGHDWVSEVASVDGRFAEPFVPHRGQYMGLAWPYSLTLRFDAAAVRAAKRPRLVATGWFYWSDASVNMAIARHPDWEFVPPILEVPDGNGGWRPLGPPVGFPAGKTKTMVIELDGALDPADPRLRISSTLRLYWDQLLLATCADDAPLQQTEIKLHSAKLWERGFSRRTSPPGQPLLEWFDWDDTEEAPRWNMHPGLYTKLGETLPLLGTIDDQFVIMGAGDALTLEFDAKNLKAPAPGLERDYLLFLDGWAKDRDPNTIEALYVTPLPFHGMSGYPYSAEEHYPKTAETRAYRQEWLTRPGRKWIEALAPSAGLAAE